MDTPHSLAEVLLDARQEPRQLASPDLLETLTGIVATCQGAWPDISLDSDTFVRFLAYKTQGRSPPEQAVGSVRAAELYLACACAQGDPKAIGALEANYLSKVQPALSRLGISSDRMQEAIQALRRKLLVSEDGVSPTICQYSGRGPLLAWLTVAVTRTALNQLRDGARELPTDVGRLEALAPTTQDPELNYLKEQHRADFKAAFQEAIDSLAPRDLHLLQLHYAEGLTTTELGKLYHVHQTTAAQWVARARKAVLSQTRRCLMHRLRVNPSECESIFRLVQSQLDITLRGFFSA